ncbi:exonuclease domain-containing protein [Microbacterium sp.]|uniref:exonuclease domain-containing protein n=1 Tax=Microbacterium sp. TaxID=51671 RepID=UPI002D0B674B|nr:exonuclease domain-containing protein [Microbacterium sp.]HWL78062.1 exonuclease domain-containing protein [Microbacterium sp.]
MTSIPDFVAIDFETANTQRSSPIQVGVVRVVNGVPRKPQVTAIMPPLGRREFDPNIQRVHGLTPQDIHGAPEWPEIHERIARYVGDLPLVAHNAAFERSVITQTSETHGFYANSFDYRCTLAMARRLIPKASGAVENHKLDTMAAHFGIVQLAHHDAGDDALVGANLALALLRMPGGVEAFEKGKLR